MYWVGSINSCPNSKARNQNWVMKWKKKISVNGSSWHKGLISFQKIYSFWLSLQYQSTAFHFMKVLISMRIFLLAIKRNNTKKTLMLETFSILIKKSKSPNTRLYVINLCYYEIYCWCRDCGISQLYKMLSPFLLISEYNCYSTNSSERAIIATSLVVFYLHKQPFR